MPAPATINRGNRVERGLHQPSLRVLRSIADALNLSSDTLLSQAGMTAGKDGADDAGSRTGAAILNDADLGAEERDALLRV